MLEAPVEVGGQQRQCLEQDVVALLLDGAADAEDGDRRLRIGAVAVRALAGERAEAREVEAVIAEMDLAASVRRGRCRCSKPDAVQVTVQRAEASFSRSSQSAEVQMSLACAEQVHGMPSSRLA